MSWCPASYKMILCAQDSIEDACQDVTQPSYCCMTHDKVQQPIGTVAAGSTRCSRLLFNNMASCHSQPLATTVCDYSNMAAYLVVKVIALPAYLVARTCTYCALIT